MTSFLARLLRRAAALCAVALVLSVAGAAPLQRDLGLGLAYFRVHTLPEDLPTGDTLRGKPCVLDVRYVRGDPAAGAGLLAWLKFHAGPHTPVFLLANSDTGRDVLAPLDSADAVAGLVILGAHAANFEPDIALRVKADVERRAYDALEKGTPVDTLITEKLDKPREDEAMLDREHLSDSALGEQPAPSGKPPVPAAPRPLLDTVLQRAVQLHRSLLALKRL
jgi:hypothetical protein